MRRAFFVEGRLLERGQEITQPAYRKQQEKFVKHLPIVAVLALALAGCSQSAKQSTGQVSSPQTYQVALDTSRGPVVIDVDRSLAPNGAKRFYDLVKAKYFDGSRFYRVVPGFVVQWGAAASPAVTKKWDVTIPDDPVKGSNTRGTITFATAGPNTRTTQLFINFADNTPLDGQGFASFGKVVEGMNVVDKINGEYGEGAPGGNGPNQGEIQMEGNAYLKKDFPNLDYIKSATIVATELPAKNDQVGQVGTKF